MPALREEDGPEWRDLGTRSAAVRLPLHPPGGGGAVLRAALQGGLARCLSPGGGLSSRVSEAL